MEKFEGSYKKSFTNEANIHRAINMYQLSLIITLQLIFSQSMFHIHEAENCNAIVMKSPLVQSVHDLNHL